MQGLLELMLFNLDEDKRYSISDHRLQSTFTEESFKVPDPRNPLSMVTGIFGICTAVAMAASSAEPC